MAYNGQVIHKEIIDINGDFTNSLGGICVEKNAAQTLPLSIKINLLLSNKFKFNFVFRHFFWKKQNNTISLFFFSREHFLMQPQESILRK